MSQPERTLSIIKPDAVEKGAVGEILALIQGAGLKIIALKMVHLTEQQARGFYAVHKERPFYGSLVAFMTRGPVVVSILEGDGAIAKYRELMGATNPAEAAEGTIRKRFATALEQTAVHGSDAPETARVETSYFFNAAEIQAPVEALA